MCTCRSASITSASLLPPPAAPPYSASGSGRLINSACRGWGRQTTGTLACTMLMVLPPPSAAAPRRTPLLLPVPLIVQGLGYTGQILEHRRGLLEVFHGACSRCAFLFCRLLPGIQFPHLLCQQGAQGVRGSAQAGQPLACFVCPMVLGISSFPPWCAGLWQKDTTGAAFPTVCTFAGP